MRLYRFFHATHKWAGIVGALLLLNVSLTGGLLLLKKDLAWLQPPTLEGAPGEIADLVPPARVIEAVLAEGHPAFRSARDIDRIDFRPGRRVHKVRSRHGRAEIQVDAVTGAVLGRGVRRSDLLEDLHDGSLLGSWLHDGLMLLLAATVWFLVVSGLYLWLQPLRRRRRRLAGHGSHNGSQRRGQ